MGHTGFNGPTWNTRGSTGQHVAHGVQRGNMEHTGFNGAKWGTRGSTGQHVAHVVQRGNMWHTGFNGAIWGTRGSTGQHGTHGVQRGNIEHTGFNGAIWGTRGSTGQPCSPTRLHHPIVTCYLFRATLSHLSRSVLCAPNAMFVQFTARTLTMYSSCILLLYSIYYRNYNFTRPFPFPIVCY
jgi:hypothetical protein